MEETVLAKFDDSVRLFSIGNHVAAAACLAEVQKYPSAHLAPLLISKIILPEGRGITDEVKHSAQQYTSVADALAFVIQRHFYAFRVLAHVVTADYISTWQPQFLKLVQCVEQYLSVNTSLLTGEGETGSPIPASTAARMARPLAAEISSLWALLWKLEVSALHQTQKASDTEAALNTLGGRLNGMLRQSPTISLEPILANLVSAACEEFGLSHKAATQRGIVVATHEAVRRQFTQRILPTVASAALEALVKYIDRGNAIGMQDPTAALANLRSMSAVTHLLAVVFSWHFRNFDISHVGHASVSAGGQYAAPEVLNLSHGPWRPILEAASTSTSSSLAIFSSLIDAVHLLACIQQFGTQQNNQQASELANAVLADVLHTLVQSCSIVGEFWDNQSKGHFARCGWEAALRIASDDVCRGRPEIIAATCFAMRRVLASMGVGEAVIHCGQVTNAIILPLTNMSTRVIALIADAEAATAGRFLNNAAKSIYDGDEGANGSCDVLLEALDHLLHGWLALVQYIDDIPNRANQPDEVVFAIGTGAAEVLKSFVNTKVSLHSNRSLLADDGSEAPESSHAIEYGNSNTQLIAVIAREDAANVCLYLDQQLSNLSSIYLECVTNGRQAPMALNEALWYVVCLIGEYLAAPPDSERPSIPTPFITLAIRCEQQWPNDLQQQVGNNPFFTLCGNVFRLTETLVEPTFIGMVSPGVCQALLCVLSRYASAYLMADPFSQSDRAEVFTEVFGGGTDAARVILNYMSAALHSYGTDPYVAEGVEALLQALLRLPKPFSQWVLSESNSPLNSCRSGGASSWFNYFSTVTLANNSQPMVATVRGRVIAFLLSVTGWASLDSLESATGSEGGFSFGSESNKSILTAEAASQTPLGQFSAYVASVLGTEMRMSASKCIDVLACCGALVDGLVLPLTASACALCGLKDLVVGAAVMACNAHSGDPLGDRRSLIAAATMIDKVLVAIGCYFTTSIYMEMLHAALNLTQYVGGALRAARAGASSQKDSDDHVELLTATAKMIQGIASWGVMDFSSDELDRSRNALVAQTSVEGLVVVLEFLDETTAHIPDLRNEVFRLMKEVTATFTGAMLSMPQQASAALTNALTFAFNSSVPDLVQCGCSVIQSFAVFDAKQQGTTGLAALLAQFLSHLAYMILCVAIDPSVTSSVGVALFELTKTLGPASVVATFNEICASNCSVMLPHVAALFDRLQVIDLSSQRREVRNHFCTEVEKLITIAQGSRLLQT